MKFLLFFALLFVKLLAFANESSEAKLLNASKPLKCEYEITNEWNTGFTGVVQLTNISQETVEGWQLQWVLNENVLTNTWNVQIESIELEQGAILYMAKNLEWNKNIKPGQAIEFGFQGNKQQSKIEKVVVFGHKCKDKTQLILNKS